MAQGNYLKSEEMPLHKNLTAKIKKVKVFDKKN